MSKLTVLPWKEKLPGERWLGEGPVGLIPFGPKRAPSPQKQSDESEQDPMAPAVEAYEKAMLELAGPSSESEQDPMAPAAEALEHWLAEQDRERMKQAEATESKGESTR